MENICSYVVDENNIVGITGVNSCDIRCVSKTEDSDLIISFGDVSNYTINLEFHTEEKRNNFFDKIGKTISKWY